MAVRFAATLRSTRCGCVNKLGVREFDDDPMNVNTKRSVVGWCFCAVVAAECLSGAVLAADVPPSGPSPVGGVASQGSSAPAWMLHLPAVNACFNALSAVLLTAGFIFIRQKNQPAHRNCMLAALVSSALFLTGYLTYHFVVHAVTPFREPAWFRSIYLTILITHTILAVVIVPLIFITLSRALRQRFDRHRKIARWTWPLWMYVSVTGVVIYLLLYQIYPQH